MNVIATLAANASAAFTAHEKARQHYAGILGFGLHRYPVAFVAHAESEMARTMAERAAARLALKVARRAAI